MKKNRFMLPLSRKMEFLQLSTSRKKVILPLSIIRHPYFHENLDEPKAKEILLNQK